MYIEFKQNIWIIDYTRIGLSNRNNMKEGRVIGDERWLFVIWLMNV